MERLEADDAAALDLDPDRITYTALGDLPTATEKARRDAPAIAVCELQGSDQRQRAEPKVTIEPPGTKPVLTAEQLARLRGYGSPETITAGAAAVRPRRCVLRPDARR